jgi:hypothetical protein
MRFYLLMCGIEFEQVFCSSALHVPAAVYLLLHFDSFKSAELQACCLMCGCCAPSFMKHLWKRAWHASRQTLLLNSKYACGHNVLHALLASCCTLHITGTLSIIGSYMYRSGHSVSVSVVAAGRPCGCQADSSAGELSRHARRAWHTGGQGGEYAVQH